jgi:hypothetical protein
MLAAGKHHIDGVFSIISGVFVLLGFVKMHGIILSVFDKQYDYCQMKVMNFITA